MTRRRSPEVERAVRAMNAVLDGSGSVGEFARVLDALAPEVYDHPLHVPPETHTEQGFRRVEKPAWMRRGRP